MINLPRKDDTIIVDLEDEDVPDLRIKMTALTDSEAAELVSGRVRTIAGDADGVIEITMPYAAMMNLFAEKFIEFIGDEVEIDGESFDIKNLSHRASLPLPWKTTAMARLVTYATDIDRELLKNSLRQDEQSLAEQALPISDLTPEATVSSEASVG